MPSVEITLPGGINSGLLTGNTPSSLINIEQVSPESPNRVVVSEGPGLGPQGASVQSVSIDPDTQNLLVYLTDGRTINAGAVQDPENAVTPLSARTIAQDEAAIAVANAFDTDESNDDLSLPDFRIWYIAGKS